jgi:hypothetical protein
MTTDESGVVFRLSIDDLGEATVRVDPKSYLPTSLTIFHVDGAGQVDRSMPKEYRIAKYQTVAGIRVPADMSGFGNITVLINPDLDTALFETRPDFVTSSNHWRKFLRNEE